MKPLKEHISLPCIYKILNKSNGLFYIGSTNNYYRRIHRHRSDLKHNRHENQFLQNSYNKYGLDNFEYIIVEKYDLSISRRELFDKEQEYVDRLRPALNILKKCSSEDLPDYQSAADKQAGEYVVSLDNGPEVKIRNLRKFCRENNLKRNSVMCVLSGEYSHTKGWRIRRVYSDYKFEKHIRKPSYIVSYLDEPEFEISNLSEFCRDRDLSLSSMYSILIKKMKQHKGWKIKYIL